MFVVGVLQGGFVCSVVISKNEVVFGILVMIYIHSLGFFGKRIDKFFEMQRGIIVEPQNT